MYSKANWLIGEIIRNILGGTNKNILYNFLSGWACNSVVEQLCTTCEALNSIPNPPTHTDTFLQKFDLFKCQFSECQMFEFIDNSRKYWCYIFSLQITDLLLFRIWWLFPFCFCFVFLGMDWTQGLAHASQQPTTEPHPRILFFVSDSSQLECPKTNSNLVAP